MITCTDAALRFAAEAAAACTVRFVLASVNACSYEHGQNPSANCVSGTSLQLVLHGVSLRLDHWLGPPWQLAYFA